MNHLDTAISKTVYQEGLTISWWLYMYTWLYISYFEMEVCVMLYESLLFIIIRIALPSNDTIAIIASGLFFAT